MITEFNLQILRLEREVNALNADLASAKAEVSRLREALKPFAAIYTEYSKDSDPYRHLELYIIDEVENQVLYVAMRGAFEALTSDTGAVPF